jgi:hypothetical protein
MDQRVVTALAIPILCIDPGSDGHARHKFAAGILNSNPRLAVGFFDTGYGRYVATIKHHNPLVGWFAAASGTMNIVPKGDGWTGPCLTHGNDSGA